MSIEELPNDAEVNEVNSQLQEGIQSCRSVVANYRTLLSGHEESVNDNLPAESAPSEGK